MATTNIELYEALREPVGDDAARMIAEVVPASGDLATKHDIADLRAATKHDIAELRGEVKHDIADLRAEMHREFSQMKGWLFGSMVPVWLGVYGTLITLVVMAIQD